ncbi:hypothetical protein EG832_22855 [bacterium]|nr:hypothetical protein [bacterium]
MKLATKIKVAVGVSAVAAFISFIPQYGQASDFNALEHLWGRPVKITTSANGNEVRYYQENVEGAPLFRVYEVQRDGQIIFKGEVIGTETTP